LDIPFVDTINIHQNPKHDLWCTTMFDPAQRTKVTFCDDYVEEGEIEFMVCGRPGLGDDIVATALEECVDALMDKADPTGAFVLTEAGPLEDASFGDADTSYRMSVRFSYTFYS
jgi:hypothetical protein